jgi:hypothetical protein
MPDEASHKEDEQVQRAKRLRDQIERLKKGVPEGDQRSGEGTSLKEQIEDRARQREPGENA